MAPSNAEVAQSQEQAIAITGQLQRCRDEIKQVDILLREQKNTQIRAQGDREAARDRRTKECKLRDDAQKKFDELDAEIAVVKRTFSDAQRHAHSVGELQETADATQNRLLSTRAALEAVRAEIAALETQEARDAAVEAAGGDLCSKAVPAATPPQPAAQHALNQQLWKETQGAQEPVSEHGEASPIQARGVDMPPELRVALQSEAVLSALQRSLCVRAAELREGLRQWGFAQGAAARTDEMSRGFQSAKEDSAAERSRLERESVQKQTERKHDEQALRELEARTEALCGKYAAAERQFEQEKQELALLRDLRDQRRAQTDSANRERELLQRQHDEAGQQLDSRSEELERHATEEILRSTAGETLAKQSEGQAENSRMQLQQTQQELKSFQEAKTVLQQAHTVLAREMEEQKLMHSNLQEDHENLNLDLNALARHYMTLLPSLPGLDVPPDLPGGSSVQLDVHCPIPSQ